MEKDLKKTLASLEEERSNSIKHKQVAVMLIKEQKKLVEKLILDREKLRKYEQALKEEKNRHVNVVEGLVEESKKSLKMEAVMEKQLSDFDVEREQLKGKLAKEETKNRDLQKEIESLRRQVESLKKHSHRDAIQSIEIRSTSSPRQSAEVSASSPKTNMIADTKTVSSVYSDSDVQMKAHTITPERSRESYARKTNSDVRFAPVGAATTDKSSVDKMIPVSASTGGGKVLTVSVSPNVSLVKTRATPPPLPPNKPVLSAVSKPAPPPKVGISLTKDGASRSPKAVHIPVSVVHSTPTESTSVRKPTTQVCVNAK